MDPLFLLQFGCFLATTLMALLLSLSRMYVRHFSHSYEVARWLLFAAMVLFAVHYLLQMLFGFRAQGEDVGTVVNILFYTPIVCLFSYATLRMASRRQYLKRYVWGGAVTLVLVGGCFLAGYLLNHGLHMHYALYAMGALFSIIVPNF